MPEVKPLKEVQVKKEVKPKTPRINYKEMYEQQVELNKQLMRTNDVNTNEVMHIAKQRDEMTKLFRDSSGIVNASVYTVSNNIKESTAVLGVLNSLQKLLEVSLSKTIAFAVEEKIIKQEDLEDLV